MRPPHSFQSQIIKALLALAVAAAAIAFGFWYTGNRSPSLPRAARNGSTHSQREKEAFFARSITPILESNNGRNAEALKRLQNNLHAQFDSYRERVPAFTADITGIGNKSKITLEAIKQLASDDKSKVQRHVSSKFALHVVSAEQMQLDLERALEGFKQDILANNNLMLGEIDAAVKTDPVMVDLKIRLPENFEKDLESKIATTSLQAGKDAVVLSGLTLVTSFAAEEATRTLVTAVLARVATSLAASMATTAAAAGGTTAAGGTGGGAVGTLGGPAGVVIGIGIGVITGVIIDYVMTERMETKLNSECSAFLTTTEQALLESPEGLSSAIAGALKTLKDAKASAVREQMIALP